MILINLLEAKEHNCQLFYKKSKQFESQFHRMESPKLSMGVSLFMIIVITVHFCNIVIKLVARFRRRKTTDVSSLMVQASSPLKVPESKLTGLSQAMEECLPTSIYDGHMGTCECVICQNEFDLGAELTRLRCGHCFHRQCIGRMVEHGKTDCPLCRVSFFTEKTEKELNKIQLQLMLLSPSYHGHGAAISRW